MDYFTGVPQMVGNLIALKVVSDVALKVAKTPYKTKTRSNRRKRAY